MTGSNERKQVCVIGLGNMGSALAEALLAKDHSVTVWNRTASKCDPLTAARGGGCRLRLRGRRGGASDRRLRDGS